MKHAIACLSALALIAAAPATRPAPTSRPAATRPTTARTPVAVALTPEVMLQSVPREFGPKGADDNRGKDNAVGWMLRKYAGQTVTLSGWASKPTLTVERGGTLANVTVRCQRPTRWLTMRVSAVCHLHLPVSDEEAARLVKLPEGRPATVELKLERLDTGGYVRTPTEVTQDKRDDDDQKRTGHTAKPDSKDDPAVGLEFDGTVEKYTLK